MHPVLRTRRRQHGCPHPAIQGVDLRCQFVTQRTHRTPNLANAVLKVAAARALPTRPNTVTNSVVAAVPRKLVRRLQAQRPSDREETNFVPHNHSVHVVLLAAELVVRLERQVVHKVEVLPHVVVVVVVVLEAAVRGAASVQRGLLDAADEARPCLVRRHGLTALTQLSEGVDDDAEENVQEDNDHDREEGEVVDDAPVDVVVGGVPVGRGLNVADTAALPQPVRQQDHGAPEQGAAPEAAADVAVRDVLVEVVVGQHREHVDDNEQQAKREQQRAAVCCDGENDVLKLRRSTDELQQLYREEERVVQVPDDAGHEEQHALPQRRVRQRHADAEDEAV
eukprot:PhM_4_TR15917/c0_g2_i1/m.26277